MEKENIAERPPADEKRLTKESLHRTAPISRSVIHAGSARENRVANDIGHGNSTIRVPRSMPSAMIFAARSADMRKGILNVFLSVIAVAMNPGFTVVTRMLKEASSTRADSRNACIAALLAE